MDASAHETLTQWNWLKLWCITWLKSFYHRGDGWGSQDSLTILMIFFAKTQPYLAACICMRTRRWRRCGGASRASSCPCTSRWCSLNRWAGSCRGWWPRRTDQSMSVEWDKSKLIATHVRKGHTCGCTGRYIVNRWDKENINPNNATGLH